MSTSMETVVETNTGRVEGYQQRGLYVFKGIPYAATPVGPRRWLPPQPVEPWDGVRQAQSYASIAPQNPMMGGIFDQFGAEEPQSEDCLYLNVWTPGLDDARRPVLFWIHGGGFTGGSGSQPMYKGSRLAARGNAVVVTINYRLGSLGFLNLNEVTKGMIPATGNEGLLDQVAALAWVRDNIAAFGGDPQNITIFGESAGGMSVGCLLAVPDARGLFHRAVLQSGAANTALTLDAAVRVAERFIDILGVDAGDGDALRSLPVDRLLAAQHELTLRMMASSRTGLPLQPVIDGATLPALPLEEVRNGSAAHIPVVVGSTLEEWKSLSMMDQELPELNEDGLQQRCQQQMPGVDVKGLIETYRQARTNRGEPTSPTELYMAIQTDRVFRIPALRLAEAQRRHGQSAFNYLFTWRSPVFGGALGACHGLEIGFLFGAYDETFSGSGPAADALSGNMQDAWVAFARDGDPSCEGLGTWPPYGDRRETMMLGEKCYVEQAPYDEERRAWEAIPDTVGGGL
ncbi:MAG: carboxylesterase/lipase family protein [Chloroflexota bacterium]